MKKESGGIFNRKRTGHSEMNTSGMNNSGMNSSGLLNHSSSHNKSTSTSASVYNNYLNVSKSKLTSSHASTNKHSKQNSTHSSNLKSDHINHYANNNYLQNKSRDSSVNGSMSGINNQINNKSITMKKIKNPSSSNLSSSSSNAGVRGNNSNIYIPTGNLNKKNTSKLGSRDANHNMDYLYQSHSQHTGIRENNREKYSNSNYHSNSTYNHVRTKTPVGRKEDEKEKFYPTHSQNRIKSTSTNLKNNHYHSNNINANISSPPIEVNTNADSIYTNYKKIRKSNNSSNINHTASSNMPTDPSYNYTQYTQIQTQTQLNTNPNNLTTQSANNQNFIFDKTFGRDSEVSEKIKLESQNYKHNNRVNTENYNLNNGNLIRLESKDSFTFKGSNNKLGRESNPENSISNLNSNLKNSNSHTNIKSTNKKDTINSPINSLNSPHQNYTADKSINKETADSNKFKMVSTHSATNSIEEVMALFNKKIEIEEVHFVSVSILQNSRRVIRQQENIPERENIYSTVTKFEERDL